jgi:hypothetical protein
MHRKGAGKGKGRKLSTIFGVGSDSAGSSEMNSRITPPEDSLEVRIGDYRQVGFYSLWGIHLLVVARAEVAQHLCRYGQDTEATGIGGVMGNKGGCVISFAYKDVTNFAFVTTHLAAKQTKVLQRGQNYAEICRNIRIGSMPRMKDAQLLHKVDHCFWFGDLNYRIDLGNASTEAEFNKVQRIIEAGDFEFLLGKDQLQREKRLGRPFGGFQEGTITFAPTYRMEKGRPGYNNKKNQNASYTDRILWRSSVGLKSNVTQLFYDSAPALYQSDHRPVSAGFKVACSLPYLYVQQATSFSNHGQCHVSFPYVQYSSLVLTNEELSQAEVGFDVKPSGVLGPAAAGTAPAGTGGGGGGGEDEDVGPGVENGTDVVLTVAAPWMLTPVTSESSTVGLRHTPAPASLEAEWGQEGVPDVFPIVADPKWLQGQHLLLTVRKKTGQLVGQAELSLTDAYMRMSAPPDVERCTLASALDNPLLARAFQTHLEVEHNGENLSFFRAVAAFKEDVTRSVMEPAEICSRAAPVMDTFVGSSAPSMVNLPAGVARKLKAAYKDPDMCAPTMFDEAAAEIYKLMAKDAWPRFLKAYKSSEEARAARGGGAPFALQLLRDGLRVGTLHGQATMWSVDVLMERDERLRVMEKFMARRASSRSELVSHGDDELLDYGVESDEEEALMAELMDLGPNTQRRLSVLGGSTGPRAASGNHRGLAPTMEVAASSSDLVDMAELEQAVHQELEAHRSDLSTKRLRALLKLTFERMKAAEERLLVGAGGGASDA